MKTFFLNTVGAFVMLVIVTSCSKKNEEILPEKSPIIGKWASVSTIGKITGKNGDSESINDGGDGVVYEMRADGTYTADGLNADKIGTYSISKDEIRFVYNNSESKESVIYYQFNITDNKLSLNLNKTLLAKSAKESKDTTPAEILDLISDISITYSYTKQ
jgi:hypothetical protein